MFSYFLQVNVEAIYHNDILTTVAVTIPMQFMLSLLAINDCPKLQTREFTNNWVLDLSFELTVVLFQFYCSQHVCAMVTNMRLYLKKKMLER